MKAYDIVKQFTDAEGNIDYRELENERRRHRLEYGQTYRQKPEAKAKYKSDSCKLARYRRGAKSRGFVFELSNEDFTRIIHSPCDYCGDLDASGIDRVDSGVGYTLDNSVSCCSTCNYMKQRFTREKFINQCEKICSNSRTKCVDP